MGFGLYPPLHAYISSNVLSNFRPRGNLWSREMKAVCKLMFSCSEPVSVDSRVKTSDFTGGINMFTACFSLSG